MLGVTSAYWRIGGCGRNEASEVAYPVPAAAVRGVYAQALPANGSAAALQQGRLPSSIPDQLALRGGVRAGEPDRLH